MAMVVIAARVKEIATTVSISSSDQPCCLLEAISSFLGGGATVSVWEGRPSARAPAVTNHIDRVNLIPGAHREPLPRRAGPVSSPVIAHRRERGGERQSTTVQCRGIGLLGSARLRRSPVLTALNLSRFSGDTGGRAMTAVTCRRNRGDSTMAPSYESTIPIGL